MNPNDFAQSVENVFYLSFLIRDGRVAFETSEEGEPIVCKWMLFPVLYSKLTKCSFLSKGLCEPPGDEDYAAGLKKRQLVFGFDMATWRVIYRLPFVAKLLT